MRIATHAHMGRDAAAVGNLLEHGHEIHAIGGWENPNVVDAVAASGGTFDVVADIRDAEAVADFVQAVQPDLFYTHFDDSLAAGTVDAIRRRVEQGLMPPVLLASPDRESSKVEWDKFFLRDILNKVAPEYNPDHNFMVTDEQSASDAIDFFEREGIQLVIKPRNPTGGKGVKVMGKHFNSYEEAKAYAQEVLSDPKQSGLEVQERMDVDRDGNQIGHEFTLQLLTDGNTIVLAPATYDYPYREDGDQGPGTGGMGTFSQADGLLPFLTKEDYDEMIGLGYKMLAEMKEQGLDYKGVLYLTAFKQKSGKKKVVEVNARGGDPELINIIDSFEDDIDYGEVLRLIALGELTQDSVRFKKLASAMMYLVSRGYGGNTKEPPLDFDLDLAAVAEEDVRVRFAAGTRIGKDRFRTASTSRIVGLSALGPTPWAARQKIHNAIAAGFGGDVPFDYRNDIASEAYVKGLAFAS